MAVSRFRQEAIPFHGRGSIRLKKVVHLTSVHPAFDIRIFHKECRTLSRAGYEVVLIAPHDRDQIVEGIRVRAVRKPKSRRERMTHTAWEIIKAALKEDADLYQFHDPELLPWAKLLQVLGKKVVFDMHENYPKTMLTKPWVHPKLRRFLFRLYGIAEYLLLMKTPVIYVENSYPKYSHLGPFATVQNMPMINEMTHIRETKYSIPTIGYIGCVSSERGTLTILKSLQMLKERGITVHWECIGDLDNNHEVDVLRFIQQHHLEGIRIRGYLPPIEGWRIISRCHVGVAVLLPLANYVESYPTKMFEYMALGLPILVSNFPLYREVVERYRCGLTVDPEKPEELANAIRWFLQYPEESEKMGLRGMEATMSVFKWETEAKKLLGLYESLLGSAKGNP